MRFFSRFLASLTKLPESPSPLFRERGVLSLKLRAAFAKIHKANAIAIDKGTDRRNARAATWSSGEISTSAEPGASLPVRVRARGETSAIGDESTFPKLRVEIAETVDLKATPFKKARKFRINTHLKDGTAKSLTPWGRLADERSPFREALGYEIAQAMGLPTPAVRRARIEYTDTVTGAMTERNALLIETDGRAADRFASKKNDAFFDTDRGPETNIRVSALFHLFHTLIGNIDVGLALKQEPRNPTADYEPLKNTQLLETAGGEVFPLVYDLDIASVVTGPADRASIEQWMRRRLAFQRARLTRAEYGQALADFRAREPAIREAIAQATVDDEGRALATLHLDVFIQTMSELAAIPMLGKKNVRFYARPELKGDLLDRIQIENRPGTLRVGTPIEVLEKKGDVMKVRIIDLLQDLTDPSTAEGYIRAKDLLLTDDLNPKLGGPIDARDVRRTFY